MTVLSGIWVAGSRDGSRSGTELGPCLGDQRGDLGRPGPGEVVTTGLDLAQADAGGQGAPLGVGPAVVGDDPVVLRPDERDRDGQLHRILALPLAEEVRVAG